MRLLRLGNRSSASKPPMRGNGPLAIATSAGPLGGDCRVSTLSSLALLHAARPGSPFALAPFKPIPFEDVVQADVHGLAPFPQPPISVPLELLTGSTLDRIARVMIAISIGHEIAHSHS